MYIFALPRSHVTRKYSCTFSVTLFVDDARMKAQFWDTYSSGESTNFTLSDGKNCYDI
jgi:hypothetical protein